MPSHQLASHVSIEVLVLIFQTAFTLSQPSRSLQSNASAFVKRKKKCLYEVCVSVRKVSQAFISSEIRSNQEECIVRFSVLKGRVS